jgi:hypothetical protein
VIYPRLLASALSAAFGTCIPARVDSPVVGAVSGVSRPAAHYPLRDLQQLRPRGGVRMIRVLIPSMPTADELLPFLREIDERKVYVNGGPSCAASKPRSRTGRKSMHRRFERNAVARAGAARDEPAAGLRRARSCGDLRCQRAGHRQRGLVPVICDVHPDTWQLDAVDAQIMAQHQPRIRCVMPVATFGQSGAHRAVGEVHLRNEPAGPDRRGRRAGRSRVEPHSGNRPVLQPARDEGDRVRRRRRGCDCDRTLLGARRVAGELRHRRDEREDERVPRRRGAGFAGAQRNDAVWMRVLAAQYGEQLPVSASPSRFRSAGRATLCPVLLAGYAMPSHRRVACSRAASNRRAVVCAVPRRARVRALPAPALRPVTEELRRRCLGLPWHEFLTEDDVHTVCAALAEAIA